MESKVTQEQKEEMLNLLKINRIANITPSSKEEERIWRKAFDLYNFGTGSKLTDLKCSKCCNAVLDFLQS